MCQNGTHIFVEFVKTDNENKIGKGWHTKPRIARVAQGSKRKIDLLVYLQFWLVIKYSLLFPTWVTQAAQEFPRISFNTCQTE